MIDTRPDFMPAQFVEWADEHRELLASIVEHLQRTGEWPLLVDLTRESVRRGRPIHAEQIAFEMPKALGFRSPYPERFILSLFGLRLSDEAAPLLAGFAEVLRLARERFEAADAPVIVQSEVRQLAVLSGAHPLALSEIVLREARFLGSGMGGPEDEWSREVTTAVVRYWEAESIGDYLQIRAEELRQSPTTYWPPPETPTGAPAEPEPGDEKVSVFISHASEDKADVARPIAEGLSESGWKVWLDEYEITVGDSLYQRIDGGLARSRCGVVILSEQFFAKPGAKQELDGLAAKETASGDKVILPVWHGVDEQYLAKVSPMLSRTATGSRPRTASPT